MDSDEAPPPYSAVDPLLGQPGNGNVSPSPHRLALRGGNAQIPDAVSTSSGVGSSASASPVLPTNFSSAAAYFVEHPPATPDEGRNTLDHHLTIYPRSQLKDFPRRPRCWNSRTDEITQQDWDTFLKYLFPPHLGLASSSGHLPRQLRAEIQRDRKDRPQETDDQRKIRIEYVISEWNRYFFEPRATRVVFVYVADPGNGPSSPLCPRCYPAATRASHANQQLPVTGPGGRWQSPGPNVHPAVRGQPAVAPAVAPAAFPPGMYAHPNSPMMAPAFPHSGTPFAPPGSHPPPNYQHYQWGWNNQPYWPQVLGYSSSKSGGPLGWISQLASQAQKYGERISEQAQQYGDQISARAEHYGRQVEEQAMAHGRWIEQQAGFGGRKVEPMGDSFGGYVNGHGPWSSPWRQQVYPTNSTNSPDPALNDRSIELTPQNQLPRRPSTSSNTSESSLSSIDSLSSTSDLSSSDLATVRAQLLSLNDHHNRDLYNAAVDLRRQLDVLQGSRRQAHFEGRHGRWQNAHNQGYGWGRWESPEQQRRNWAEKRAKKEEMKATKKAFRDVLRRAREEQREQRRAKRTRRRLERRSRKQRREGEPAREPPLEQRLENLELERRSENNPAVQSAASRPRAQSDISSGASEISVVSTPSTASSEDAKAKSKDNEKPEESQKQPAKLRKCSKKQSKTDEGNDQPS